jgi:hypothetical protein
MPEDAGQLAVRYLAGSGFHICAKSRRDDIPEMCLCRPGECLVPTIIEPRARGIKAPVMVRFPVPPAGGEL